MSSTDLLFFLGSVIIGPWLVLAWFRIPRYVRGFQQAAYDSQTYAKWLRSNETESRYQLRFFIVMGVFPFVFCGGFCFFTAFLLDILANKPLVVVIAYLAFVPIAFRLAPRDALSLQNDKLTARVIWLLAATFFIEFLVVVLGLGITQNVLMTATDPKNSPESMILAAPFILFSLLVAAISGPIVFGLTPYIVPVANLLSTPLNVMLAKKRSI